MPIEFLKSRDQSNLASSTSLKHTHPHKNTQIEVYSSQNESL